VVIGEKFEEISQKNDTISDYNFSVTAFDLYTVYVYEGRSRWRNP